MRITRITAIERGFFVKTFWTCLSAFCKPVTFDSCLNVNAFSGTNTTETINIYINSFTVLMIINTIVLKKIRTTTL